jgi:hypothetical protein
MSTNVLLSDEGQIEAQLARLRVKTLNISLGGKVTQKDITGVFRSFDASVSWTFVDPEGDAISLEAARKAQYLFSPLLVEKICADLFIAGVMDQKEAAMRIREARVKYQEYAGYAGDERGADVGGLSGAGAGEGPAAAGSAGTAGAAGEAPGVPPMAGPRDRPVGGGDAVDGRGQEAGAGGDGSGQAPGV